MDKRTNGTLKSASRDNKNITLDSMFRLDSNSAVDILMKMQAIIDKFTSRHSSIEKPWANIDDFKALAKLRLKRKVAKIMKRLGMRQ